MTEKKKITKAKITKSKLAVCSGSRGQFCDFRCTHRYPHSEDKTCKNPCSGVHLHCIPLENKKVA